MTKVCFKCSQSKSMDDFYDNKANKDGKDGYCKECRRRYSRTRRTTHLESGETWAYTYTWRCKKAGIDPVIEHFSRQDVIDEYGNQCFYCHQGAFEELDHFRSVAQGGLHTLDNVRPSCAKCNSAKRDSSPLEFISRINDPEWKSSTTKVCGKCSKRKSMDDFYNAKFNRDGKEGSCKECKGQASRKRHKERYANDPEYRQYYLDYSRRYYHNRKAQQPEPA